MSEPTIPEASLLRLMLRALLAVVLAPWRVLRWFGRGLRRRARVLLYLLIALVVIHLVATLITGIMLRREVARLRTSGYLLSVDQLAPKLPPGKPNAAVIYQKGFDLRRVPQEVAEKRDYQTPGSKWSPEQVTLVRRVL